MVWTIGGNFYDLSASSVGENDDVGLITPHYDEFDFLTAVYTGQEIRFYVDGTLTKAIAAQGEIAINSNLLTIGAYSLDPALNRLSGTIDEIRIYNRAISEQEIQALYALAEAISITLSKK